MFAKLPEFQRQYPEIQLVLTASDGVSNLIDDGLDCTLRLGELADASYIARRLTDVAMQTCASSDRTAIPHPTAVADLSTTPVYSQTAGGVY